VPSSDSVPPDRWIQKHDGSFLAVLQQIRQQSDLLLICLGESKNRTAVLAALTTGQQHKVPPVLVLDQRLSQGEVSKELHQATEPDEVDSQRLS